ncbi:MAG: hypothetical protein U5N56_08830 [Candidatus Marinimicrobia bacterium]|nr:hypothetical protein [Candidatus Neomarinimicrobiota bacterium]
MLIHYLSGTADYGKVKGFIDTVRKDPGFRTDYHSIIDVRDLTLDTDIEKMNYYMENFRHYRGERNSRRHALLISTPEHYVMATYMKEIMNNLSLHINIFTTLAAAVSWLEKTYIGEQEFEKHICQLRGKK